MLLQHHKLHQQRQKYFTKPCELSYYFVMSVCLSIVSSIHAIFMGPIFMGPGFALTIQQKSEAVCYSQQYANWVLFGILAVSFFLSPKTLLRGCRTIFIFTFLRGENDKKIAIHFSSSNLRRCIITTCACENWIILVMMNVLCQLSSLFQGCLSFRFQFPKIPFLYLWFVANC